MQEEDNATKHLPRDTPIRVLADISTSSLESSDKFKEVRNLLYKAFLSFSGTPLPRLIYQWMSTSWLSRSEAGTLSQSSTLTYGSLRGVKMAMPKEVESGEAESGESEIREQYAGEQGARRGRT